MVRRAVVHWAAALLLWAVAPGAHGTSLADYAGRLPDVLVGPGQFSPLPRAGAPFWRDSIPLTMRQSYIRYGEQYLGQPWTTLPVTVFAEFKENGNRVHYESLCFEKRRHLAALVMAEVAEGEGRFVPDIINGLSSFCEETWWGIPAHYGQRLPLPADQPVDLFNAETAGLVVWAAYMLRPQLDRFTPLLWQRICAEVERRILTPARTQKYWWKTAGMNWNPWICSNWLACVLLCETDRARQLDAVGQILSAMDAFVRAYPADGGCDEGPGYWDRAAASLYECLNLLLLATDGHVDERRSDKIRAMAAYTYKTYIDRGYVLCFADSHDNRSMQQVNIVFPFGLYVSDRVMTRFARYVGDSRDLLHQSAQLYDRSGNFPTLGRELFFLRTINAYLRETPQQPLLPSVWLPDLQIWTCRAPKAGLFVAVKGGHNGESHNHNDVGQLVVYADGEPLLIDVGVGEYTAKTFSAERYTLWTMQSQYHNLPQINGTDQKDGRQYAARVVREDARRLTLDLAGAYPESAGVGRWLRTVSLWQGREVRVTEDYELRAWQSPTRLMLLTTVQPDVSTPGVVALGRRRLCFDASRLTAEAEDISPLLDPLLQGMWGRQLYRIVLTLQGDALRGTVRYSVR